MLPLLFVPARSSSLGNKAYTDGKRELTRRFSLIGRLTRMYYKRMFDAISSGVVEDGRWRRMIDKRCRAHLASIQDPELRRKLTPDYVPGCKRLILSGEFYPTLQKQHVELVAEPIERIEARGIVTADGVLHAPKRKHTKNQSTKCSTASFVSDETSTVCSTTPSTQKPDGRHMES